MKRRGEREKGRTRWVAGEEESSRSIGGKPLGISYSTGGQRAWRYRKGCHLGQLLGGGGLEPRLEIRLKKKKKKKKKERKSFCTAKEKETKKKTKRQLTE